MTRLASASLVAATVFCWLSSAWADAPAWPEAGTTRRLVEAVLPSHSEWFDGHAFAERGSRGATYVAAGLLWRDGPHDRAAAADTLRAVLDLQYADGPESELHGLWRRHRGETEQDANWREFVGCGLILILETFPDRIPADLADRIRAALLRAADGSARRDVGAGYTNIALMSALLLDYAGAKHGRADLQEAGRKKAEAIDALFATHKTFDEYNSPTYYGTDLMALAQWRQHACSPRLRELGRQMEVDLWRDIGAFYHAGLRNLCGPYIRAYGMDMTQYCALAGLWIALAVDDPELAPWPTEGGRHQGERAYAPVFALLGAEMPAEVLPQLRGFAGPRFLERPFRDTKATAFLDTTWMMGAATMKRQWDQHHPATLHWQAAPDQPLGWALLTGLNDGLRPVVADGQLRVFREKPSDEPIQWLLFAPGLQPEAITSQRWNLPGLTVSVEGAPGFALGRVDWIDHPRYGRCLEVTYAAPSSTARGEAILTLSPQRP